MNPHPLNRQFLLIKHKNLFEKTPYLKLQIRKFYKRLIATPHFVTSPSKGVLLSTLSRMILLNILHNIKKP